MTTWIDISTSGLVSSSSTREGAAFALGLSISRRTEILFTALKAMSMTDITSKMVINSPAMKSSLPLNIGTFAASAVRRFSFHRHRFRGHIPSDVAVRAREDGEHSFRTRAFLICVPDYKQFRKI